MSKLSKPEIVALYRMECSGDPRLARALERAVGKLYPTVVRQACYYYDDGVRKWQIGGTPALCDALTIFREFIEAVESGQIVFYRLDRLFSACHNNGTFADVFIECAGEQDANQFLDSIARGV